MAIQGEDIQVRLTLTDGTSPIAPSTLDAYSVSVYYLNEFNDKINLATYKSSNTGLYDIVVFSDVNGEIDIIINRELTKTITSGKLYAEVFTRTTATSEFISSKSINGVNAVFICDFYTSSNSSALS
jgi:hypothetical protein